MVLVCLVLQAYQLVLLAYVVFSWVPRPPEPLQPLVAGVGRLVDPVVEPIRRRLPGVPVGGVRLDLSIIVVFIAIALLQGVLC